MMNLDFRVLPRVLLLWLFIMSGYLCGCGSPVDSVGTNDELSSKPDNKNYETIESTLWLNMTSKLPRVLDKNGIRDIVLTDNIPPRLIDGYQVISHSICNRTPNHRVQEIEERQGHKIVHANIFTLFHEGNIILEPQISDWRNVLSLVDAQGDHWKAVGFFLNGRSNKGRWIYEIGLWRDRGGQVVDPTSVIVPHDYYIIYELPIGTKISGVIVDNRLLKLYTPLLVK